MISEKYAVHLSLLSVGRLLALLGLVCPKPLMRAFQQNTSLVKHWLKVEYRRIQTKAKRIGAEIFFADEAGIRSGFYSDKTWAPRSQAPNIKVTDARFGFNMLSAVSPKGNVRFMVVDGKVDGKQFCEFLRRLCVKATRPLFLILDGHPVYRSAKVKKVAESLKGKLQLFFLPPYSPEFNPEEFIWKEDKNNGMGRISIRGHNDMKRKVVVYLKSKQQFQGLIRSFHHAASALHADMY